MLDAKSVESGVRFFDGPGLELLRWVSERYVAPLATVIGRYGSQRTPKLNVSRGVTFQLSVKYRLKKFSRVKTVLGRP
jgi:hypothetical protein